MTITSKTSGSQSATISTEHTLATITDPGVYVLVVDTVNLAAGDQLELRAKTKCKSGSSSRLAFIAGYAHAQAEINKYSVPIPIDTEVIFTLKQVAGTGRSFDWNILQVG